MWLAKSSVCPWRNSRFIARTASGALAAISPAHSVGHGQQLVVGHGPVHEPDALGLRGVDVAPEVADLGGLGPAEEAGQVPGAARLGHDAPLGEARQELGRLGHQAQVAAEGEVEAVAGGGAVEDADHRRVHLLEDHGRAGCGSAGTTRRRRRPAPMPVPATASLMSRPAQKPLPAPVRSTHAHVAVVVGLGEALGEQLQHAAPRWRCGGAAG